MIETQYRRHSPWLTLTSAASLVAILNSVVLGTGLTGLAPARWQAVSEAGTWRLTWPARPCAAGLRCGSNPGSSTRPSDNQKHCQPNVVHPSDAVNAGIDVVFAHSNICKTTRPESQTESQQSPFLGDVSFFVKICTD